MINWDITKFPVFFKTNTWNCVESYWILKDGRNNVASDLSVDIIYQDEIDLLVPNTAELEESKHISKRFDSVFCEAFPSFTWRTTPHFSLFPLVFERVVDVYSGIKSHTECNR